MDSVVETSVCLSVPCLRVCKFSHFSLFHPSLFIQYSTEECSTVQLLASSLEYPQRIEWSQSLNRLSDCSLFLVSKLARDPEYPQRIRVASVFETFDCLLDCSFSLSV